MAWISGQPRRLLYAISVLSSRNSQGLLTSVHYSPTSPVLQSLCRVTTGAIISSGHTRSSRSPNIRIFTNKIQSVMIWRNTRLGSTQRTDKCWSMARRQIRPPRVARPVRSKLAQPFGESSQTVRLLRFGFRKVYYNSLPQYLPPWSTCIFPWPPSYSDPNLPSHHRRLRCWPSIRQATRSFHA